MHWAACAVCTICDSGGSGWHSKLPTTSATQPHSVLRPVPAAAGTYVSTKAPAKRGAISSQHCIPHRISATPPSAGRDASRPQASVPGRLGIWDPPSCVSTTAQGDRGTFVLHTLCPRSSSTSLLRLFGALLHPCPFFIYPNRARRNQAFACWMKLRSLFSLGDPGKAKELGPGPARLPRASKPSSSSRNRVASPASNALAPAWQVLQPCLLCPPSLDGTPVLPPLPMHARVREIATDMV